jgi:hypothetical protein
MGLTWKLYMENTSKALRRMVSEKWGLQSKHILWLYLQENDLSVHYWRDKNYSNGNVKDVLRTLPSIYGDGERSNQAALSAISSPRSTFKLVLECR